MRNFSGVVAWYLADRIPCLLACMEFKHFDNLYRKQQNCPCLRMKNYCLESVGCSFRTALWFPQWFCLCEVLWDQCYNLTFLLFSPSSVMILLAFLSCFLVFFFLPWGPNSFFSIKENCCVFEQSVPCAYFFHCVIAIYNRFRVLHAVDSLNVKHELRSKRAKHFCIM